MDREGTAQPIFDDQEDMNDYVSKAHHVGPRIWYYTKFSISANNVELHAPASSTQKLKLAGKGGLCIYTLTSHIRSTVSCPVSRVHVKKV